MSLAEPMTKEEWQEVDQIFVKLLAYPARAGRGTAGLPGKVTSIYIVPLDRAYQAGLAGHVPVKTK